MATIRTNTGRIAINDLIAGGPATQLDLGLFTAPGAPDVTTVLSGVTEATFPGYARTTMSLAGPSTIDANGNASRPASPVTFTQSMDASPETVIGWFVEFGGVSLVDIKLFDSGPQVFAFAGDFRTVIYTLYQGQLPPPL